MSFNQTKSLDEMCDKISERPEIRFCGVVNEMGKLIAGGFKQNLIPFVNDETNRTAYMQLCLELSMRKDFDDLLGPVDYISAKRKKVTMISIPLKSHVVIISAEPFIDVEAIANFAIETFQEFY